MDMCEGQTWTGERHEHVHVRVSHKPVRADLADPSCIPAEWTETDCVRDKQVPEYGDFFTKNCMILYFCGNNYREPLKTEVFRGNSESAMF